MTARTKAVPMGVVKIGYQSYLMPAAVGLKLVQLLTQAVECEDHYEDRGYVYEVGDAVDVTFRNVRANQIRMPGSAAEPAPRRLPHLKMGLGE